MFGKGLALFITAGSVLLSASGCTSWKSPTAAIDPPPFEEEQAVALPGTSGKQAMSRVTIVMADGNGQRVPLLVPSDSPDGSKNTNALEKQAKQVIAWMADGALPTEKLPQGFHALLPTGTALLHASMKAKSGELAADLNGEFLRVEKSAERPALEAVVWALSGLPGVKSVNLLIEGESLDALPQGGTPLKHPMTRLDGINLSVSSVLTSQESQWFQLSEAKKTADGYAYQVPVSKWLPVSAVSVSEMSNGKTLAADLETMDLTEVQSSKNNHVIVNEWNWK